MGEYSRKRYVLEDANKNTESDQLLNFTSGLFLT